MKPYIKYFIISAAIALTACNNGGAEEAATASQTEISSVTENISAASETTTLETTTASATETTAAEAAEEEYAEVSPENVFIDYKLIEDYQPTDIRTTIGAKAVDFLAESEYYAETEKQLDLFTGEEFKEFFDEGGNIVPKLHAAYPEDYDGDGKTETFILVDMPYVLGDPVVRTFLIFADKDENLTILDDLSNMLPVQLLDYGSFKQIVFGGYGVIGADSHTALYGVIDGQAKELYGFRGGFSKSNCFVAAFGHQGSGDFLYYDTAAQEYRAIVGERLDTETVKEMDSTGELSSYFDAEYYDGTWLVGGRYYVVSQVPMDFGTAYLYEDGAFVRTEECENVRLSWVCGVGAVRDIDIDKALSEMISAEDAALAQAEAVSHTFVEVSPDNVFIDFKFKEDYKGTAVGEPLAEKAAAFLKTTDEYADSQSRKETYKEDFPEYFDSDGNILPIASLRFTEDFDGDGKKESFLTVDMPCYYKPPQLRSFVFFADSENNLTPIEDSYGLCSYNKHGLQPFQLLDYGSFKQLIIEGIGVVGAGSHTEIYGVIDGEPKILDRIRGSYRKTGFMLGSYGWMSSGATMYYDTAAKEYRNIVGKQIDYKQIMEMDSTNVFEEYTAEYNDTKFIYACLIGGKYYCACMDRMGFYLVCTYENGVFVPVPDDSAVRYTEHDSYRNNVVNIDINKALSEMISVE